MRHKKKNKVKRHWNVLSKTVVRLPSWMILNMIIGLDIFYLNVGNLDLMLYKGIGIRPGYKSCTTSVKLNDIIKGKLLLHICPVYTRYSRGAISIHQSPLPILLDSQLVYISQPQLHLKVVILQSYDYFNVGRCIYANSRLGP